MHRSIRQGQYAVSGLRAPKFVRKIRRKIKKTAAQLARNKALQRVRRAVASVLDSKAGAIATAKVSAGLVALGVPPPVAKGVAIQARVVTAKVMRRGGWAGVIARGLKKGKKPLLAISEEVAGLHLKALPSSVGGMLAETLGSVEIASMTQGKVKELGAIVGTARKMKVSKRAQKALLKKAKGLSKTARSKLLRRVKAELKARAKPRRFSAAPPPTRRKPPTRIFRAPPPPPSRLKPRSRRGAASLPGQVGLAQKYPTSKVVGR